MPSVSKAQQRFMGLVHAYKKGEVPASQVSQAVKAAAKSMKKKSTKKFASTKHDDLPDKVREYVVSENPAAAAAAAMVMMKLQNPDTGKKISAITPLRNKDHKLHKKSKGIFQRLKDKFMKKKESVNEDGHTDVASAERKLKLIMKDAMDTLNALRSLSNEDSLPSWWTDKITLAKDYVGKSRDYIMNPAESVDESVNEKTISIGGEDLMKYLMKRFKMSKSQAIASMKKHKMDMSFLKKESVNEGISVSDERHFGKKGIIIMIDDNGKKVSAIFKDKKNAKEFNRNKPADIKKLLQLAKKTKYPKAIDESINEDITTAGYYFLRKAAYSIEVALKDLNKGIKKQEDKRVLPEIEYIYDKATDMKKMMKNKRYNESVNEGKGVEKILKMADEKSFGKIAGRTVDGMTAGLFKAVYDKAPQNAKDKIDKMSEKQLYVFMGKLWNKFGRQVKLS